MINGKECFKIYINIYYWHIKQTFIICTALCLVLKGYKTAYVVL